MRQHAYPKPRRSHRRRRVGIAGVVAAAVVLTVAALASRSPLSMNATAGLAAGPKATYGLEPTPTGSAAPTASSASAASSAPSGPSPRPIVPAGVVGGPVPTLYPAHVGLDSWPRPTPPPLASLTGYVWPLAHPRLTLPFGPTPWGSRVVDGKLFHDGVDLATFCGDHVLAAHAGTVLAAGRHFDDFMGWVGSLDAYYRRLDAQHLWPELPNVVVIDDGNGYRSMYAHFSTVSVHVGQSVHAGQLIGYEGMTGHATGCHVHYGLYSFLETATFGIEPKVARDMRLPKLEIARIDPLLVLPYRRGLGGVARPMGG